MSDPGVASSLLTQQDLYLFNEGSHLRLYDKLGAHLRTHAGVQGCNFAVWAPGARYVSVIGDFNGWDKGQHPLSPRESSGIWEGFVQGVGPGAHYKFHIASGHNGYTADKIDPIGFAFEKPPQTASIVADLSYEWQDGDWMRERKKHANLHSPLSIYEVHLGSWRHVPEDGDRWMTYRELAEPLTRHAEAIGLTHVE